MNKYSDKGITLIALVITVIIVLILAVVAVSAISGNDGLFSKANMASKELLDEWKGSTIALEAYETNDLIYTKSYYALGNAYNTNGIYAISYRGRLNTTSNYNSKSLSLGIRPVIKLKQNTKVAGKILCNVGTKNIENKNVWKIK